MRTGAPGLEAGHVVEGRAVGRLAAPRARACLPMRKTAAMAVSARPEDDEEADLELALHDVHPW